MLSGLTLISRFTGVDSVLSTESHNTILPKILFTIFGTKVQSEILILLKSDILLD